jgi:hypothetical protein
VSAQACNLRSRLLACARVGLLAWTRVGVLGVVALAPSGCDDAGKQPLADSGAPRLELGVAAGEFGQTFAPFSPGDRLFFAGEGQAALLMRLAVRSWGMGMALVGQVTVTDQVTGRSLLKRWERLLLYCEAGQPFCEQVPVYVSLGELGLPDELDGHTVRLQGQFGGMMGQGPIPFDLSGVLTRL